MSSPSERPVRTPQPTRRQLLVASAGLGAAVGLAACGGKGESTVPEGAANSNALLASFPQSVPYVPAGVPTRLPYLISDPEGVPLAAITGPVTFTVSSGGDVIGEVEVLPRSDGVPRAYLPLEFTFDEPGYYDVVAEYEGQSLDSQLQVFERKEVPPPVVGEQLPVAPTPTTLNSLEVDPICTRVPACPYHEVTLQEALDSGKRVVLLVATPAYCQTAVCGPTLDNLMAIVGDRDDLVVVHTEVYRQPKTESDLSQAPLAPLPEAYGLAFEPTMFVTDTKGTITARADIIIDRSEMTELLA